MDTPFFAFEEQCPRMGALAILDLVDDAVLVLDRSGNLKHANRSARRLACDSPLFSLSGRAVTWGDPKLEQLVHDWVVRLQGDPAAPLAASTVCTHELDVLEPHGQTRFRLTLRAIANDPALLGDSSSGCVVVLRHGALWPTQLAEATRLRYRLTPAEWQVCTGLMAGLALPEIAAKLRVSHHTVRSHLRQIFEKTGTHHQLQLVAHMRAEQP